MSAGSSLGFPKLSFLRRKSAEYRHPISRRRMDLIWSLRVIPRPSWPITVTECKMESGGMVSYGFGDALFARDSIRQAFAEAWERLWFKAASEDPTLLRRRVTSSNGFACGSSPTEALSNARGELIERSVVLTAWRTRSGWTSASTQGIWPRVLAARLSKAGWDLRFFALHEPHLGDVVCGLACNKDKGAIFDSSFRDPATTIAAVQAKVARSIIRSLVVAKEAAGGGGRASPAPTPAGHAEYYREPENLAAFEFLRRPDSATDVHLGHYGRLESRILISEPGFPVVAAVHNDSWPQLSWGLERADSEGNPWPHPIA